MVKLEVEDKGRGMQRLGGMPCVQGAWVWRRPQTVILSPVTEQNERWYAVGTPS